MFAAIGKTLRKSAPAMLGALLCAVFAAARCEAAALRVAVRMSTFIRESSPE